MESQLVFQEKTEMERLRVQNRLLSGYEKPILAQMFSERCDLAVLDVGCNDGMKTVEQFTSDSVSRVIGLEYNPDLVQTAQQKYGDERFSFYHFDVEGEEVAQRLRAIMDENQIEAFDVIYLSFLLMHLSDVSKLLAALKPFLKEDGKLFIIEANDRVSTLNNDQTGLLGEFLEILRKEKYSGNREVGAVICEKLADCGYKDICVWHDFVSAGAGEPEKKQDIFTTFFTYLAEDITLLLNAEPENEEYRTWAAWIESNYSVLKDLVLQDESMIAMGIRILTCGKGREND